jgi:2-polyprenyl-6-methoxyphenol hydroxylase-like FAD-dependent oxidoreductase
MQSIKLAIIGAGPVGLIGAYAFLKKGYEVDLFDPFLFQDMQKTGLETAVETTADKPSDLRYISLNHGSIALLDSIGIHISHLGQKIETVHINTAGFWGACTMRASENQVPALAYSIHYQHLQNALFEKLQELASQSGRLNCISAAVKDIQNNINFVHTNTSLDKPLQFNEHDFNSEINSQAFLTYKPSVIDSNSLETKYYHHILICEGGTFDSTNNSANQSKAESEYIYHDQAQNAYIGFLNLSPKSLAIDLETITPDPSKNKYQNHLFQNNIKNIAWECFTQEGPLAILPYHNYPNPLIQATHIIVWCQNTRQEIFKEKPANPKSLKNASLRSDFAEKLSHLMQKLDGFSGYPPSLSMQKEMLKWVNSIQWQQSFELGIRYRKTLQNQHLSYLGNAAQIMHPVAGQGLNLGIRQMIQASRDFGDIKDAHQRIKQKNQLEQMSPKRAKQSLIAPYKLNQKMLNQDRQQMIMLTALMAKGFESSFFSKFFSAGLQFVHSMPWLKKKLAHIFMYGGRH